MFFANRVYSNRVTARVEVLLLEYLGSEDGLAAVASMREMLSDTQLIELKTLLKGYRNAGLTVDDAAISLIDGTVTSLRRIAEVAKKAAKEGRHFDASLVDCLIPLFERALDKHMQVRPGRVVPRNGRFGEAASKHMSEFLKDMEW